MIQIHAIIGLWGGNRLIRIGGVFYVPQGSARGGQ